MMDTAFRNLVVLGFFKCGFVYGWERVIFEGLKANYYYC